MLKLNAVAFGNPEAKHHRPIAPSAPVPDRSGPNRSTSGLRGDATRRRTRDETKLAPGRREREARTWLERKVVTLFYLETNDARTGCQQLALLAVLATRIVPISWPRKAPLPWGKHPGFQLTRRGQLAIIPAPSGKSFDRTPL